MLIHVLLLEMVGVHLLIMQWSHLAAWILTSLDLYFLFTVIAHYRASVLSPIILQGHKLYIQKGLLGSVEIDCDQIAAIKQTTTNEKERKSLLCSDSPRIDSTDTAV